MNRTYCVCLLTACLAISTRLPSHAADPWADHVGNYLPGSGIDNDFFTDEPFNNAQAALGEPTRFTSDADHSGGATTPLQSSFRNDEIVSIGRGGSLTVSFDEPVTNDPNNPFGIDLLIFGNSFLSGATLFNDDYSLNPAGTIDRIAADGGLVELSDDGVNFVMVPNIEADGLYPTYGYQDQADPFPTLAGQVPTDFTRPVNPALDVIGNRYAEILAGYDGSGGGAGIDIGIVGFEFITHVRVSNPSGASFVPEIDAFADVAPVPEPTTLGLASVLAAAVLLYHR